MNKEEMIVDIIKWLDDFIDSSASNCWQVRKTTMAKKLLEYRENTRK